MSTEKKGHLDPEELVASVVGEELSPRVRRHLDACPECRRQKELVMEDLKALGWSARRFAPEPARKIVLPAREPSRGTARTFGWSLGLSVAAAAAGLILILSPGHPGKHPAGPPVAVAAWESADDERLMTDVGRLEEDALPEGYREISPEESTAAADDDATLDFVVPIDDEGGLS